MTAPCAGFVWFRWFRKPVMQHRWKFDCFLNHYDQHNTWVIMRCEQCGDEFAVDGF